MPIVNLQTPDSDFVMDTPKGFSVTPGLFDMEDSESPNVSYGQAREAAYVLGNTFGSTAADLTRNAPTYDEPDYKPWEKIKGTKYEPYWDRFVDIRNSESEALTKKQIDNEEERRKTLAQAPWYYSIPAQLEAGVIDWPTLLPAGTLYKGARGLSALKSALSVGGAAGVSTIGQEAILHGTQQTRRLSESAANVGGSVILGGVLGATGSSLLNKIEWGEAVKRLDADLARVREGAATSAVAGSAQPSPAGAAAVEPMDIEGNTIAGKAAGAVAAATAKLNPALRLLQSPSPVTREVGTKLFESSIYLRKNLEGAASEPAVETLMKEYNAGLARAIETTDAAFANYRRAGGSLSRVDFEDAVGRAMRRGDQADDPHITQAAQAWRRDVFDPLKNEAIKSRLLPEDVAVETADSYFSRMWNRNALIAREGEFKGIVQRWVSDNAPKWAEGFDRKTEANLAPLRREIDYEEMAKLRRSEELRRRAEGGEVDAGEFGEADIRSALRIVEGGAPAPKGVKTLTQFVAGEGGLVDFGGELAYRGITNKARPGFVRSQRRRFQSDGGGWSMDDMARHAWERGYFPDHVERPSIDEFLNALQDDFFKTRPVLRAGDQDAYRLTDLVERLRQDLARVGVTEARGTRFATSDEVKGIVARVYKALDAEADRKIAALKAKLSERGANFRQERDSRFLGDHNELGRSIADDVFNTLTGKTGDHVRPEFITVKARGPLKERTFNIPDALVEQFLENNVKHVGSRYTRIMGADVEMQRKFGSVDMAEQIQRIREDYRNLRSGVTDEKELAQLGKRETADVRDIEALRDLLRGTRNESPIERNYGRITRAANMVNYIRSMGEVVLASLTDAVRPAMVHGLGQFMQTVPQLLKGANGIKLSVNEAKLAGNVVERVLGHRLATISEIMDPYASRGPVEALLENGTNVASKWNGIRIWTDMMKSVASVMTQDRILANVTDFGAIKPKERAYLAFLGIDQSMAERIAKQFTDHGEIVDGVKVANTESWTDPIAVRTYRAAMNKDVDSIIVQKGVADVPLFASTPTGRMLLQFKSFALASHQRVLLRGLQEDQSRFVGGMIAMTAMGMLQTYLKALSGNRTEKQTTPFENPGWWIGEGLDRSGVLSVPMEIANTFERATGFNPIKSPMKLGDETSAISQKNQNRNEAGALLGPTVGLAQDVMTAGSIPMQTYKGEEVTQAQKSALERLLPFSSYPGLRQIIRYVTSAPE